MRVPWKRTAGGVAGPGPAPDSRADADRQRRDGVGADPVVDAGVASGPGEEVLRAPTLAAGRDHLYAVKGERVTCQAGHYVCQAGRDIPLGKPTRGDFVDWQNMDEPAFGAPPPHCQAVVGKDKDGKPVICNVPWWQFGKYHFYMGGWR